MALTLLVLSLVSAATLPSASAATGPVKDDTCLLQHEVHMTQHRVKQSLVNSAMDAVRDVAATPPAPREAAELQSASSAGGRTSTPLSSSSPTNATNATIPTLAISARMARTSSAVARPAALIASAASPEVSSSLKNVTTLAPGIVTLLATQLIHTHPNSTNAVADADADADAKDAVTDADADVDAAELPPPIISPPAGAVTQTTDMAFAWSTTHLSICICFAIVGCLVGIVYLALKCVPWLSEASDQNIAGQLYLFSVFAMALATGTCLNLLKDWWSMQPSLTHPQACRSFDTPILWNFFMAIGMAICYPIANWCSDQGPTRRIPPESVPGPSVQAPWSSILLVATMDSVAFLLLNYAQRSLVASTIQGLAGSQIIFTVVFSMFILQQEFRSYQWLGLLMITIGAPTLGWMQSVHSEGHGSHQDYASTVTSVIFCIASAMLTGLQLVFESIMMTKHSISPLYFAGAQGVAMMPMCVMLLLVANASGLEDSMAFFSSECSSISTSVVFAAVFVILTAVKNFCSNSLIKHGSAMLATISQFMGAGVLWAMEVVLVWAIFTGGKLMCMLLVAFGGLIYGNGFNTLFGISPLEPKASAALLAHHNKSDEQSKGTCKSIDNCEPFEGQAHGDVDEEFVRTEEYGKNLKIALTFDQAAIDVLYEHMEATVRILNDAGVGHVLIAGSALGFARHGGLIPWDNDVDIGVHEEDFHRIWTLKPFFEARGYHIIRADIGFKTGTGKMKADGGMIQEIDGELWAIGPDDPFTGINQDIFTFKEDGEENGVPVMRYTAERALRSWPKEVMPTEGWRQRTQGMFGGFLVSVLPERWNEWMLSHGYGPKWKTHDGFGEPMLSIAAPRLHSSKASEDVKPGQYA